MADLSRHPGHAQPAQNDFQIHTQWSLLFRTNGSCLNIICTSALQTITSQLLGKSLIQHIKEDAGHWIPKYPHSCRQKTQAGLHYERLDSLVHTDRSWATPLCACLKSMPTAIYWSSWCSHRRPPQCTKIPLEAATPYNLRNFYGPRMFDLINGYMNTCFTCQMINPPLKKLMGYLYPLLIADYWEVMPWPYHQLAQRTWRLWRSCDVRRQAKQVRELCSLSRQYHSWRLRKYAQNILPPSFLSSWLTKGVNLRQRPTFNVPILAYPLQTLWHFSLNISSTRHPEIMAKVRKDCTIKDMLCAPSPPWMTIGINTSYQPSPVTTTGFMLAQVSLQFI